jgi:hypothetical protein
MKNVTYFVEILWFREVTCISNAHGTQETPFILALDCATICFSKLCLGFCVFA